ncbi:hypothetical protein CBM2609_B70305 [Cupriavidus taiwanensis]|nr:hypothetical protein CBM2604_B60303 [Cupriavidus taiwanensis]SOZ33362.1 hypothetical protein CBM2609_B70305 [Cupriavidus taiwanensis]SOZ48682.1 hypothetical protein CBM2610_B50305 [Cupriavidus taiwanensis]
MMPLCGIATFRSLSDASAPDPAGEATLCPLRACHPMPSFPDHPRAEPAGRRGVCAIRREPCACRAGGRSRGGIAGRHGARQQRR